VERDAVIAAGQDIEVVEGPVELVQLGPVEVAVRNLIVVAMAEKEIARGEERRAGVQDPGTLQPCCRHCY
jgi:hypothetical protein